MLLPREYNYVVSRLCIFELEDLRQLISKNSHLFNFIMRSLLKNSHGVRRICKISDNVIFTYWKLNTTIRKIDGLILASFLHVLSVLPVWR